MLKYKQDCAKAEEDGKRKPELPLYFAQSIMLIAERLSRKPQFIYYSYLDEMIGDGILACIKYASSYNPEKYENPFAYFTQVIYHAFLGRLNVEQSQHYTKALIVKNSGVVHDDEHFSSDSMNSVILTFENKMSRRKAKEAERQKAKAEKNAYEETSSKNGLQTNGDLFESK